MTARKQRFDKQVAETRAALAKFNNALFSYRKPQPDSDRKPDKRWFDKNLPMPGVRPHWQIFDGEQPLPFNDAETRAAFIEARAKTET